MNGFYGLQKPPQARVWRATEKGRTEATESMKTRRQTKKMLMLLLLLLLSAYEILYSLTKPLMLHDGFSCEFALSAFNLSRCFC